MRTDPHPTHAPGRTATDTAELQILHVATLDRWLGYPWEEGVQLDQMEDLRAVRVCTRNSTYTLAIVCGVEGRVLVRGGQYFPDWTDVHFLGCSCGGGLLKRHGVHVGLRMEFYWAGKRILTSPVATIECGPEAHSDAPAPGTAATPTSIQESQTPR